LNRCPATDCEQSAIFILLHNVESVDGALFLDLNTHRKNAGIVCAERRMLAD
jgi:hypothetical protein